MLLKIRNLVRDAQEHASSCARRAAHASTSDTKAEWFQIERSWTKLAESYLLVESLQQYLSNIDMGDQSESESRSGESRIGSSATASRETDSNYLLLAEACRRKAEAEKDSNGKLKWLELAKGWENLATNTGASRSKM